MSKISVVKVDANDTFAEKKMLGQTCDALKNIAQALHDIASGKIKEEEYNDIIVPNLVHVVMTCECYTDIAIPETLVSCKEEIMSEINSHFNKQSQDEQVDTKEVQ